VLGVHVRLEEHLLGEFFPASVGDTSRTDVELVSVDVVDVSHVSKKQRE